MTSSLATAMLGLRQPATTVRLVSALQHGSVHAHSTPRGTPLHETPGNSHIMLCLLVRKSARTEVLACHCPFDSIKATEGSAAPGIAVAPAGRGHAHEGELHGVRPIQQGVGAGRRRRAPLGMLAPEQLARRLPKMADLVLHGRALPAQSSSI